MDHRVLIPRGGEPISGERRRQQTTDRPCEEATASRLSRLSRIVNVTELMMKPLDADSDPPKLRVTGIATTFRFLEDVVMTDGGA